MPPNPSEHVLTWTMRDSTIITSQIPGSAPTTIHLSSSLQVAMDGVRNRHL